MEEALDNCDHCNREESAKYLFKNGCDCYICSHCIGNDEPCPKVLEQIEGEDV